MAILMMLPSWIPVWDRCSTIIREIPADDEASIRNGLRSAVESLDPNLQVLGTARNGLEAWEFIQTYSPDLVITDIRMPICDGLEQ